MITSSHHTDHHAIIATQSLEDHRTITRRSSHDHCMFIHHRTTIIAPHAIDHMPSHAIACHRMPSHAIACHRIPSHATTCLIAYHNHHMSSHAIAYRHAIDRMPYAWHAITLPWHAITYHRMPLHAITYHHMPPHAITCHHIPLPSHAIACHRMPSHAVTYHHIP